MEHATLSRGPRPRFTARRPITALAPEDTLVAVDAAGGAFSTNESGAVGAVRRAPARARG